MVRLFGNRHSKYQGLLTEHVDGRLDAQGDAELRRHLATCESCAVELREMLALAALLRSQPQVEAPRSFALPYAPRQEDAKGRVSERRGFMRTMQVATATAALTLVVLIGADLGGAGADASLPTQAGNAIDNARSPEAAASAAPAPTTESDGGQTTQLFAPASAEPVPVTLLLDEGRSAFRWAEITLGILTAAMALGIVALTWGPARPDAPANSPFRHR